MRISVLFCVASALLVTVGCKDNDDSGIFSLNGADARDMLFEDVADVVSVIPLNSEQPIELGSVYVFGKELFITDEAREKLWYFKNNELISVLDAHGRGHGEYTNLFNISYHPQTHTLYVKSPDENNLIKYKVPSMRFDGKIPYDGYVRNFVCTSQDRFLATIRNNGQASLSVMDSCMNPIRTIMELSYMEEDCGLLNYYKDNKVVATLCDYDNRICFVDSMGTLNELFRFRFSDGIPKNVCDVGSDESKIIDYSLYQTRNHFFYGAVLPLITDDDLSFWYCNNNGPEGDDSWLWLYHKRGDEVIQAKNLTIPGLNLIIQPDDYSPENGYYTIIQGPEDLILDPLTDPSPLASRILDAVRTQNDDNPIVISWKLK